MRPGLQVKKRATKYAQRNGHEPDTHCESLLKNPVDEEGRSVARLKESLRHDG